MKIEKLKNRDNKPLNIVLSGVGGQGVLVASDIIVEVAMKTNLDAKKSEVHGMAQRGGSVVSQVRYGTKIYSPLIKMGDADIILAFEKLEAIRYLDYIKPEGYVIFNTQQITPLTVFTTNTKYPQNISLIGFTQNPVKRGKSMGFSCGFCFARFNFAWLLPSQALKPTHYLSKFLNRIYLYSRILGMYLYTHKLHLFRFDNTIIFKSSQ